MPIPMRFSTRLAGLAGWVAVACAFACGAARAQTTVADAWVRGTVAQQQGTGAFMRITSVQGGQLVAVRTPLAALAEVHEMAMVDGVMKMGAVPALALPAGQAVELKPGGYHVMLMGLKQPLRGGDRVPLTLTIEARDGKRSEVEVSATVRALGQ